MNHLKIFSLCALASCSLQGMELGFLAFKKAVLCKVPPMISVLEGHTRFNDSVLWNPNNKILVSTGLDSQSQEELVIRDSCT